jgi:aspartyl/glutamyl-tRNA(Asn/Gln) amidotransferase C subunit
MQLTEQDIERLAEMSRLRLADTEKTQYAKDCSSILSYVSEIQSVDVPEVHDISDIHNVWREDLAVADDVFRTTFLREVPHQKNGYVQVKQIL